MIYILSVFSLYFILFFQVFSPTQEKELKQYVVKCMEHYYGLSPNELRELAYQLVSKIQIPHPDSWEREGKASRNWYYRYMKRHPELTLRTPEQTSMNRVKAFCKTNADRFYANLGKLKDEYGFDANDIYKRGRKPMQSAELTSPENIAALKERAAKKKATQKQAKTAPKAKKAAAKATTSKVPPPAAKETTPQKATPKKARSKKQTKPPAKRSKQRSSQSSDEDTDFCIICLTLLPKKLTAENSIKCNSCRRPVHLKCANIRASYYTCKHCDSDLDDEAQASE